MDAEALKHELLQTAAEDSEVSDERRASLTEAMLEHIGSLDPQLRDELIYETFSQWIHQGRYSPMQLQDLLLVCLDQRHLMWFPEGNPDAVFTRAFSQLVIAEILHWHQQQQQILTPEVVIQTAEVLIEYMHTEADRRGYVPDKGWAHAIAHLADSVKQLLGCPELRRAMVSDVLEAARDQIGTRALVYGFGEDERLASAVVLVLERDDFSEADFARWLDTVSFERIGSELPGDYLAAMNRKHFLRSLFFQMRTRGVHPDLVTHVDALLRKVQQSRLG